MLATGNISRASMDMTSLASLDRAVGRHIAMLAEGRMQVPAPSRKAAVARSFFQMLISGRLRQENSQQKNSPARLSFMANESAQ